jgi:hypothetical protein
MSNFPHTTKYRIFFGFALSVFFIYLGIQLLMHRASVSFNPMLVQGLGIISILFFGGLIILGIKKIVKKEK